MELRCTCGAYPPGDARFCHRCGRPLRESSSVEIEAESETMPIVPAAIATPPPLPSTATEISLHNSLAIRVCLLAAAITILLSNVVGVILPGELRNLGSIALLGASGVLAVFLYRRRSGGPVSVLGGARLGWITGVFCFLIILVLVTLLVLLADEQSLSEMMRQAVARGQMEKDLQRNLSKILEDPATTLAWTAFSVIFAFVTMSMMASVGGALGAKYFGQRHSS